MSPKSPGSIVQLKIILRESDPAIWRRVQVSERLTLAKLHQIIQIVMGWTNSHLHEFEIGTKRYSDPDFDMDEYAEEEEEPVSDEKKYRLADILRKATEFEYRYDFGDGWRHQILVEKYFSAEEEMTYPICIGGATMPKRLEIVTILAAGSRSSIGRKSCEP